MAGKPPKQRSIEYHRSLGHLCGNTEHWNPYARRRQDLFNFADFVVIVPGRTGTVAIQATTASNMAARIRKIFGLEAAKQWCAAENEIWVEGWAQRGRRGRRKKWCVKAVKIRF